MHTKHTFGSALAGKSGSKREGTSSDANTSAGGRHSSVETVPTFCPLTRTTSSAIVQKRVNKLLVSQQPLLLRIHDY